jgi:hypothetical protein
MGRGATGEAPQADNIAVQLKRIEVHMSRIHY